MSKLTENKEGLRALMMGNEAIVRGALEAGVADESTGFHCAGHETVGGKPMKVRDCSRCFLYKSQTAT